MFRMELSGQGVDSQIGEEEKVPGGRTLPGDGTREGSVGRPARKGGGLRVSRPACPGGEPIPAGHCPRPNSSHANRRSLCSRAQGPGPSLCLRPGGEVTPWVLRRPRRPPACPLRRGRPRPRAYLPAYLTLSRLTGIKLSFTDSLTPFCNDVSGRGGHRAKRG